MRRNLGLRQLPASVPMMITSAMSMCVNANLRSRSHLTDAGYDRSFRKDGDDFWKIVKFLR